MTTSEKVVEKIELELGETLELISTQLSFLCLMSGEVVKPRIIERILLSSISTLVQSGHIALLKKIEPDSNNSTIE